MTTPQSGLVHFLLVDDLEENLLALDALLRRDDLVLLKARSGPEALELLLTHHIGLALLDVQMPGMDGFELAEHMRSTERTRRVPIIFLTAANADGQRRFRGYEAGAVDFLHKPIEPDILRSKAGVFFELSHQQLLLSQQRDELKASAVENARLLEESRHYAQALKEADRRKDEFLATLAHELRNPLAPVRSGLQILRMSPDSQVGDKVRDMMDRQLTHLVKLIDDLLDVSRVSEGKINLQKEKIAVQAVVEAAVESSQPLIEASRHRLVLEVPKQKLWISADLTRMAQVLGNLLNNAAKYTPEGGSITLAVREEGSDIVLAVTDNGLGIPADMLPKVFELFTQVNSSLERSQGGLGIGLALARRLVEMHGGSINATSAGAGQGSTFTIRVPALTPASISENDADIAATAKNAKPLRVLVVDDNVDSAKTMGWMLEYGGHEVKLAHDGLAVMAAAKEQQPHVILLDIGLPGMNGYDVCRALRQEPSLKNTVLVAQTGWGQERDKRLAIEAGFDHHLIKPVRLEDLTALMAGI